MPSRDSDFINDSYNNIDQNCWYSYLQLSTRLIVRYRPLLRLSARRFGLLRLLLSSPSRVRLLRIAAVCCSSARYFSRFFCSLASMITAASAASFSSPSSGTARGLVGAYIRSIPSCAVFSSGHPFMMSVISLQLRIVCVKYACPKLALSDSVVALALLCPRPVLDCWWLLVIETKIRRCPRCVWVCAVFIVRICMGRTFRCGSAGACPR